MNDSPDSSDFRGAREREEGGPLVLEKTVGEDMSSEAAKFCLEQKGEVDS